MDIPSMDKWIIEAKEDENASRCGMYLFHNGVVREDARSKVRGGKEDALRVSGMKFSYDAEKIEKAEKETLEMPGIYYVRTWLNSGELSVGDAIMMVLIGGDIRPNVINALDYLVGEIKSKCVCEEELF